jgi:choline dehydrogenase
MVPELEPFRQALTKAWVSKGQILTEDVYSDEVNGLVMCMNTIYKGVRSNSSCFLTGKSNITIMATSHAKKLVMTDKKATHRRYGTHVSSTERSHRLRWRLRVT